MSEIFPIVMNSTTYVDSNTFVYKFPRGSINLRNSQISLSQLQIYYSWPNLDSEIYGNTTVIFKFPESDAVCEIPNGNYDIVALNSFFQSYFISINKYLVNAAGQNVYYFEILTNPQTYSIQIICYSIPTILPIGFTNPAGMTFPLVSAAPQIEINEQFGNLIGYTAGIYGSSVSNKTPEMSPVGSVIIGCSLLNNKYTNPPSIMYSFISGNAEYGSMLNIQPQELIWNNIPDGQYSEIVIKFYDSRFNRIKILDKNLVIYLIIKLNYA